MSKHLDYDDAVGILHALVEEKGADYVYTDEYKNCVNWDSDGQPRCIVGHLMAAKQWIPRMHTDEFNDNEGCAIETLANGLDIDLDRRTMDLLRRVQGDQDQGLAWGRAVEHAIEQTKDGVWVDPEDVRYDDPF